MKTNRKLFTEASTETSAKTKPGQRRPAAGEFECAA